MGKSCNLRLKGYNIMAGKKENIKALFTNSKTRTIILFTGFLLCSVIIFGVYKFYASSNVNVDVGTQANLKRSPHNIKSIPGSVNQTAQYAALQQEQNLEQAKNAAEKGGSAIPTIIRSQQFGQGVDIIGAPTGTGGVGFVTLSIEEQAGPQQSIWTQDLEKDRCNVVTLKRVLTQGATLRDIHPPCSCSLLKDNGFVLKELATVCACPDLKMAGFNAAELKNIGYTATKLKQCGYSACEVRGAGFTAQEMKDGGYSDGELSGAGFNRQDIDKASGIPEGMTVDDIRKAGCNPAALADLRKRGVSAAAIVRVSGCSLQQLKAAGFTAAELKAAGFTAAELKAAGFTAAELKAAGFSPRDLLNAGFSEDDLKNSGFPADQIASALSDLPPGVSLQQIASAGCQADTLSRETQAGISPEFAKKISHCTSADIKSAGCDLLKLKKLRDIGVSAKEIHNLNGCSAAQLKAASFTANNLSDAGFDTNTLNGLGLTPLSIADIKAAGCDPVELKKLREKGVTAKQIHELNGCSAAQLRAAGFSAKDLADAGFSPAELLASGFTPEDLVNASLIPSAVIASGRTANCSVESLKAARAAGVSAKIIKETLGCSAAAMRAAGFTAAELKAAGFTAAQLKAAGFSAAELKAARFSAAELKAAGFSAAELKVAGFSAAELKAAGFSPADLKAVGFTATELKAAGLSPDELKSAGFSAAEMKAAGVTPSELKAVGFNDNQPQALESQFAGIPSNVQSPFALHPVGGSTQSKIETKELQQMMNKQQQQAAQQRYQAQITQKTGVMMSAAKEALQTWKKTSEQVYVIATKSEESQSKASAEGSRTIQAGVQTGPDGMARPVDTENVIKTGDIMFAVMDTSVNTDEPGPILATIVSGRLKGSKLIGSFNLPSNASKIVIMFNTLSIPGKDKTVQISAYAIDPNTARTALSSETNHHYLQRYGALFASSFMSGMSSAIQSANTTVSVGGTGGVTNTTVSTIGRSTLDNALIALGEVGKSWSKTAQKDMNRPTTVEVYAGTGLGILFTQDVAL
jgi:intracellular multiplication protein IcmE